MQHRITININALTLGRLYGSGLRAYVDKARFIEDSNIDGIVMPDHVVFGGDAVYPFGGWPVQPEDSWPEPMAVLAALAGATRSLDLITNVLVAPLRPAALLAKQVATLAGLADGRFQLGVGAGWQRQEYEACGVDFAGRSQLMFEQLQACTRLWQDQPASFQGQNIAFDDIWCSPGLPARADGSSLPLWFGVAPTAANARFFAEFGGGWSCIHPDPAFIAEGRATLQAALKEQFGIDAPLRVRAAPQIICGESGLPCVHSTIDNLAACVRAGVTDFDFPMLFYVRKPSEFEPFVRALGDIDRNTASYL